MKISKNDIKQSNLYKMMLSTTSKRMIILLFLTFGTWIFIISSIASSIFNLPLLVLPIYCSIRVKRDYINANSLSMIALQDLEFDEFSKLQMQALREENRDMFGIMTDYGIIVGNAFIPYNSIIGISFNPKKWRWDGWILGFGLSATPATMTINYSIDTGKKRITNKKIKNLPTNRDISSEIELFMQKIQAESPHPISFNNEYCFVN